MTVQKIKNFYITDVWVEKKKKGGASAPDAEAGKEGFRAAGLVRPELFSTPSPS